MFARADDQILYGKKGNTGLIAFKANTCMIVATHNDGQQMGAAMQTVGRLGDYLIENNF